MTIDDEFNLCNDLYTAITDRFGSDLRANALPESPRTVLLVWHATGIIDNGGFEYLFEGSFDGDPGFSLTLKAFEAIGADSAANAFRNALALFPKGKVHSDIPERINYYQSISEDVRLAHNRQFWLSSMAGSDEIKSKLAQFIRVRRADFDW